MIDPTTDVGKVRLRVADISDLPLLPDSVYESTLADTGNNLPNAAQTIAGYILGMLAFKTHRKLANLEVWGAEAFQNYRAFLQDTINNPTLIPSYAISLYAYNATACNSPIGTFVEDWKKNYTRGTQSAQLHFDARLNPIVGPCGCPDTAVGGSDYGVVDGAIIGF